MLVRESCQDDRDLYGASFGWFDAEANETVLGELALRLRVEELGDEAAVMHGLPLADAPVQDLALVRLEEPAVIDVKDEPAAGASPRMQLVFEFAATPR